MPQEVKEVKEARSESICLADGIFNLEIFNDPKQLKERLLSNGIHPNTLNYIFHTSLPKGHSDHLSDSEAARQFFPNVATQTAKFRALKGHKTFVRLLLYGKQIDPCAEIWANRHKKTKSELTRPRIPIEVKAKARTELELRKLFRSKNNLGDRGKMKENVKEACDKYVSDNYDKAFGKILEDMKDEVRQKTERTLASV